MNDLERERLREKATHALRFGVSQGSAETLARGILNLLDDPCPDGYSLVKKPELLDKGVPSR